MPMDAWREGDTFVIEFDLPGVAAETIDIDVERNVLTVRAERARRNGDWEMLASERPTRPVQPPAGARRQPRPRPHRGELRRAACCGCTVPVAERAKPRKIQVGESGSDQAALSV